MTAIDIPRGKKQHFDVGDSPSTLRADKILHLKGHFQLDLFVCMYVMNIFKRACALQKISGKIVWAHCLIFFVFFFL